MALRGLLNFVSISKEVDTLEELEIEKGKVQIMVMKMSALILGAIMLSVVIIMLIGMFFPNDMVDSNEIFKIIGPAFSMIVGAFVGSFATMMNMKVAEFDPNLKVRELGKNEYEYPQYGQCPQCGQNNAESIKEDTDDDPSTMK